MQRSLLSLCLATLLCACGGGGSDTLTSPLEAKWSEAQTVVGSSLIMSLHVEGEQVSGTGTYAIEAGQSGTLSVSGTASGTSLIVTLSFDNGHKAIFNGVLSDSGHLDGRISYDLSPSGPVSFVRS